MNAAQVAAALASAGSDDDLAEPLAAGRRLSKHERDAVIELLTKAHDRYTNGDDGGERDPQAAGRAHRALGVWLRTFPRFG